MIFGYVLSTLALLGLLGAVGAQSTTTTLLMFGFDPQPLIASVVAFDATATTYVVDCLDASSGYCGLQSQYTLTQGPSTVRYRYARTDDDGAYTYQAGCVVTTDHGLCSYTVDGYDVSTTIVSNVDTISFDSSDYKSALLAVTVTAGPSVVPSTPTPAITSTPSTSGTASGVVNTGSTSPTASIPGTLSSTGGAPAMTNAPLLFIGGVLAFAAM